MPGRSPLRVELDGTPFMEHRRSGITRYLTELISAFDRDPRLGVEAVTPYRYLTNAHAPSAGRKFRSLPLPRRWRRPVLDRLNRRYADAGAVDLTHFPWYDAAALERARERRSATTVYDFTFEVFPELFGDVSAELALKAEHLEAADVLLCISEATRQDLERFHPGLDKPVVVTPLAVGDEFRNAQDRPVRGLPKRYLLHVGNRVEHKNVELLLRAFKAIADDFPDLHLVLSGQGMATEPERLEALGITARTRVLRLSDRDLPSAYRRAEAFVFPSRYEGFGLPVVEAMAAGCPTVVTDAPALLEVVGDAADVVDPDDVDALAAALERLLGDPQLAARRRTEGRERAASFTWQRTAELTALGYEAALRA
jgi:glycosyltransferase involved in cell wall biosynthesis